MSTQQINQWRTVGVVVFACLLLIAAFITALVLGTPEGEAGTLDLERAARLYEYLSDAVVWLVAAVALKSGVEHLGRGGGLRGAKAALLTDAQPGQPPTQPGSTP